MCAHLDSHQGSAQSYLCTEDETSIYVPIGTLACETPESMAFCSESALFPDSISFNCFINICIHYLLHYHSVGERNNAETSLANAKAHACRSEGGQTG